MWDRKIGPNGHLIIMMNDVSPDMSIKGKLVGENFIIIESKNQVIECIDNLSDIEVRAVKDQKSITLLNDEIENEDEKPFILVNVDISYS